MAQASISSELYYQDPQAALAWLEGAFGFEIELLIRASDGGHVFARVGWNGAAVGIFGEAPPGRRSPLSLDGAGSQTLHVRFEEDIDAHFARARDAGATILSAPREEFYADRTYTAADLEGHVWVFGQRVPDAGGPPPDGWTVDVRGQRSGGFGMTTLDLQSVFLALNGAGTATSLPGENFMVRLGQAPADMAYLVGVYPMTVDWDHWEMHPKGCEILTMLEGRLEMTLDLDGALSTVMMAPGATLVVPAGGWHTAKVLQAGRLLAITYGEGTQHRPL